MEARRGASGKRGGVRAIFYYYVKGDAVYFKFLYAKRRICHVPRKTNSNGQLLTVENVAEMLQLKPSTVRAYAERGSISCVRAGNRLRFRASDVDLWIEQRRSKGGGSWTNKRCRGMC